MKKIDLIRKVDKRAANKKKTTLVKPKQLDNSLIFMFKKVVFESLLEIVSEIIGIIIAIPIISSNNPMKVKNERNEI